MADEYNPMIALEDALAVAKQYCSRSRWDRLKKDLASRVPEPARPILTVSSKEMHDMGYFTGDDIRYIMSGPMDKESVQSRIDSLDE